MTYIEIIAYVSNQNSKFTHKIVIYDLYYLHKYNQLFRDTSEKTKLFLMLYFQLTNQDKFFLKLKIEVFIILICST